MGKQRWLCLGLLLLAVPTGDAQAVPKASPKAPSAAGQQSPAKRSRIIVLVTAPKGVGAGIAKQLTQTLAQDAEVLPAADFLAAAKQRLGRSELSMDAVTRLAQPLNLAYAVQIRAFRDTPVSPRRSTTALTLEVVLVSLQPQAKILLVQRYALKQSRLDEATAKRIAAQVRRLIREEQGLQATAAIEAEGAGGYPAADELDTSMAHGRRPGRKPAPSTRAINLTCDVGLAMGKRFASINGSLPAKDGVPGTLSYGHQGFLGNAWVDLALHVTALTPVGGYNLGVDIGGFLGYARQVVEFSDGPVAVHYAPWQLDAQAAWRLQLATAFHLLVEAGYWARHFPSHDGPFPGLFYQSPIATLRLGWQPNAGPWRLSARASGLFYVRMGDEVTRLGTGTSHMGYAGGLAATYHVGTLDASLSCDYQRLSASFAGRTFIYTAERYANVKLVDAQLRLGLLVGKSF